MCALTSVSSASPASQPAPRLVRPAMQPGSCMLQTTTTRTANAAAVANTADSSAALRLELCENLRSLAIASFLCLN